MNDEKVTGGPVKSRLPKSSGTLPRVSISLPDELKGIISKEAGCRGVTVSKYVTDILTHMHDGSGIKIPDPITGPVDVVSILNAINTLADEVRIIKDDMQGLKGDIYTISNYSAAQRSTIKLSDSLPSNEKISESTSISEAELHYEALKSKICELMPDEVDHSAAQLDIIPEKVSVPDPELREIAPDPVDLPIPHVSGEKEPAPKANEKILLTPNMHKEMRDRMKAAGMNAQTVATKTGMSLSKIKKYVSLTDITMKTIARGDYQTMMSL